MVREHDGNEWSLKNLRKAIRKEDRVFEADISTTYPAQQNNNYVPSARAHAPPPACDILASGGSRIFKRRFWFCKSSA